MIQFSLFPIRQTKEVKRTVIDYLKTYEVVTLPVTTYHYKYVEQTIYKTYSPHNKIVKGSTSEKYKVC